MEARPDGHKEACGRVNADQVGHLPWEAAAQPPVALPRKAEEEHK